MAVNDPDELVDSINVTSKPANYIPKVSNYIPLSHGWTSQISSKPSMSSPKLAQFISRLISISIKKTGNNKSIACIFSCSYVTNPMVDLQLANRALLDSQSIQRFSWANDDNPVNFEWPMFKQNHMHLTQKHMVAYAPIQMTNTYHVAPEFNSLAMGEIPPLSKQGEPRRFRSVVWNCWGHPITTFIQSQILRFSPWWRVPRMGLPLHHPCHYRMFHCKASS